MDDVQTRRIIYMYTGVLGKFYYDPETHEGVSITDDFDPVIVGMDESFDPYLDPKAKDFDVELPIYEMLFQAGRDRNNNLAGEILKNHFPDTYGDETVASA